MKRFLFPSLGFPQWLVGRAFLVLGCCCGLVFAIGVAVCVGTAILVLWELAISEEFVDRSEFLKDAGEYFLWSIPWGVSGGVAIFFYWVSEKLEDVAPLSDFDDLVLSFGCCASWCALAVWLHLADAYLIGFSLSNAPADLSSFLSLLFSWASFVSLWLAGTLFLLFLVQGFVLFVAWAFSFLKSQKEHFWPAPTEPPPSPDKPPLMKPKAEPEGPGADVIRLRDRRTDV